MKNHLPARIVALTLAVVLMLSLCPAAFAANVSGRGAKYYWAMSCGDALFGKTSTITVKNTTDHTIYINFYEGTGFKKLTGCIISPVKTYPLHPNRTQTYKVCTSLGKVGQICFKIYDPLGENYSYSINFSKFASWDCENYQRHTV